MSEDIALWNEAIATRDAHDPAKQPDNGYHRCALCHYTRHPCDAYSMADEVIKLLKRLEARESDLRSWSRDEARSVGGFRDPEMER